MKREVRPVESIESETFSTEDLIAILMAARRGPEEDAAAFTVLELAEMTGWGGTSVTRRLRKAMEAGEMECVRKPFVRIDGVATTVPAYRLRRKHDDDDDGRGED